MRKMILFILTACMMFATFEAAEATDAASVSKAVNCADSIHRVRDALQTEMKGVFYPEEIFAYLIGRDFANDDAVMQELYFRQKRAEENPHVALFCDGERILSPQAGNLSLTVTPIIKRGIFVLFAVYDGNKLVDMDVKEADGVTDTVLSCHLQGKQPNIKILFLDSFTEVSPTDFYGASKMSVYLSETGNDETGIGTKKRPFCSIEKAKAYANSIKKDADSDVHVTFLPGTYTVAEPVTFGVADSGYGDYSIVYRGEPGADMPLISGGVKVTNPWEVYKNGIYRVFVPEISEARQMYINGIPAQRSVCNGTYIATEIYQKEGSPYAEDGFVLINCNLPDVSKPSELEMVSQIKWVTQRLPVEQVWTEGDKTYFSMDQPMYDSYVSAVCSGGIQPKIGSMIYFENALEFIDEPGEFYFDTEEHMLYYYPFAEENPETAEVYLPKSEGVFRIEGSDTENRVKNLRFSHLDIRHGAWNEVSENGFCSFQADCRLEYDVHGVSADNRGLIPLAQIGINCADNITVSDCRISNVGSTGIGIHNSVTGCMVERNAIHDISGSGVSVGSWRYLANTDPRTLCENVTVQNNYITRIGQEYMGSLGLGVYIAKNVSLLHNDIKDVPYTGISVGWNWHSGLIGDYAYGGHRIIGNRIDTIGLERKDGGQIYTLGNLSDTEISENYLINSNDYGGIYLDSGSSYVNVERNVVEKCQHWLFLNTTSGKDSLISGNYSDMDNLGIVGENKENYVLENTHFVPDRVWTGESAEVVHMSGIEIDLRNAVMQPMPYPEWRKSLYAYIPRSERLLEGEYLIEAEDYIKEAGEGYYKKDGKTPVIYDQNDGRVIGSFYATEWCKYRFSVKEAGVYLVELRAGSGPDPMAKPNLVTVEINDVAVLNKVEHSKTPLPWEVLDSTVLGYVELRAGENTMKIINEQNGWTFDNVKLTLVEEAQRLIEGEDYIDEAGVGYYKKDGTTPVVYAQNDGHVIGNFFASEWCKYNFSVDIAGTYRVELRAGSGPDPMAKPNLATVEIDDVAVLDKVEHSKTPSGWEMLYYSDLGTVELDAGNHTMKIINEQNGWTYDKVKLTLVALAKE